MKKCPDIIKIKDKMLQFGADAAQMSGSGPTVFGISQKNLVLLTFTIVYVVFVKKFILLEH